MVIQGTKSLLWRGALLVALTVTSVACSPTATVTLSEAEIQEHVARTFPKGEKTLLYEARLDEPDISLRPDTSRMALDMPIMVRRRGGDPHTGRLLISATPIYDPQKKAFFLGDTHIESLEIDGAAPDTLTQWLDMLREPIAAIVQDIPLYELDKNTVEHKASRAFLKEVYVEGDALKLVMGW